MSSEEGVQYYTFEELYLRERKKAIAFIVVSAVLAVLLVGSIVYGLNNKSSQQDSSAYGGPSGQSGPVRMGPGGGSGGPRIMPQDDITDYLNDDGTVDTDAIDEALNSRQGPPEMMEALRNAREDQIDEALADGEITEQQAADLKAAWGIE